MLPFWCVFCGGDPNVHGLALSEQRGADQWRHVESSLDYSTIEYIMWLSVMGVVSTFLEWSETWSMYLFYWLFFSYLDSLDLKF